MVKISAEKFILEGKFNQQRYGLYGLKHIFFLKKSAFDFIETSFFYLHWLISSIFERFCSWSFRFIFQWILPSCGRVCHDRSLSHSLQGTVCGFERAFVAWGCICGFLSKIWILNMLARWSTRVQLLTQLSGYRINTNTCRNNQSLIILHTRKVFTNPTTALKSVECVCPAYSCNCFLVMIRVNQPRHSERNKNPKTGCYRAGETCKWLKSDSSQ